MKEYKFRAENLEKEISHLAEKGVTELVIHDEKLSKDKKSLLRLIKQIEKDAPDLFVSILTDASIIDREIASAASQIFCSLDIPLRSTNKGGKLLFDKKYFAGKAGLLNDFGLVFGFYLSYGDGDDDSLKLFTDRLDFAVQQYPNHIDFPQTETQTDKNGSNSFFSEPKVTGLFSAQDIRYARDLAFAIRTFYSAGRAVPWMLSVLKPLKIHPSRFFADFAEWQRCNNCDFKSGFIPEGEKHKDIEKMQLLFLEQKFEEKNKQELIPLVHDIVTINGAISRLCGENEESVVETSYHPDELLGPESMDIVSFADNVCMEDCRVKIFAGEDGPDYAVL